MYTTACRVRSFEVTSSGSVARRTPSGVTRRSWTPQASLRAALQLARQGAAGRAAATAQQAPTPSATSLLTLRKGRPRTLVGAWRMSQRSASVGADLQGLAGPLQPPCNALQLGSSNGRWQLRVPRGACLAPCRARVGVPTRVRGPALPDGCLLRWQRHSRSRDLWPRARGLRHVPPRAGECAGGDGR